MRASASCHRRWPWPCRNWATNGEGQRRAPRARHRPSAGFSPAGFGIAHQAVGRGPRPRQRKGCRSARGCRWSTAWATARGVKNLALEMHPAGDLGDAAAVQPVIARVGIGLEEAAKAGEMGHWMRGGAIRREAVPGRKRRRAARCRSSTA